MGKPFCFHINSLTASNSCSREVPIVVSMALVSIWRRHADVDMLAAAWVMAAGYASIVAVVIDELSWKLWLYAAGSRRPGSAMPECVHECQVLGITLFLYVQHKFHSP